VALVPTFTVGVPVDASTARLVMTTPGCRQLDRHLADAGMVANSIVTRVRGLARKQSRGQAVSAETRTSASSPTRSCGENRERGGKRSCRRARRDQNAPMLAWLPLSASRSDAPATAWLLHGEWSSHIRRSRSADALATRPSQEPSQRPRPLPLAQAKGAAVASACRGLRRSHRRSGHAHGTAIAGPRPGQSGRAAALIAWKGYRGGTLVRISVLRRPGRRCARIARRSIRCG
jgi:hypothetical protein